MRQRSMSGRCVDLPCEAQECALGWCQTDSNQSQFAPVREISGRAELTPLGKSGGTVELEIVSAIEVAFQVEVVVDG